jgi:hypothetical protein
MERSLQEGLVPLHRHVRARLKVREVCLRNRAPRKTFALQSIETVDAPVDWPARPTQHSI